MFRLAEEVGRAKLGIHGVVGNDHRFGRAGEEVDPDAAVKLALGFGDIGVAGPDQHVDGLDAFRAKRHRAHGLHPAKDIDLMRAAHVHGRDNGRVGRAAHRRGRGDDPGHPRHGGGQDRHVGRGDHRELAAGDVAADRLNRNVAVAEDDAGQRLDLDIRHAGALHFGKPADLALGKADILDVAGGDLLDRRLDLGRGQKEGGRVVLVELH